MKFTSWQLVVILALLLAAVIVAHVWAPGAVALVASAATTIIGTLFVQRAPAPPLPYETPDLRVIDGGKGDGPKGAA